MSDDERLNIDLENSEGNSSSDDSLPTFDSTSSDGVDSLSSDLDTQVLTGIYSNEVTDWPLLLRDIAPSANSTFLDYKLYCYFPAPSNRYSSYVSDDPIYVLGYTSNGFLNPITRVVASLDSSGSFHYLGVAGYNSSENVAVVYNCAPISDSPLYYGVTSSGGEYPTETILTLLSIVSFLAIVWACFRIFIYPFYRRIRR